MFSNSILAQDLIENYTYVSDLVFDKTHGLPVVRSIGGGTKIIVNYEGKWSENMKGAFEYACKIWEEAMPTTFPIHVLAVLDDTKKISALSKVSIQTYQIGYSGWVIPTNTATWLQMKGTTFAEYIGIYDTHAYTDFLTQNMFNGENDIVIRYYNKDKKLENNCDFSTGETIDNTKYDFVTLVLRDLAKGFGISWQYNNPNLWPNIINENRIIPYESYVLGALGYWNTNSTQASMRAKATQGSLTISNEDGSWDLYAPAEWDNNYSLSTFIPNDRQKITELLSYEFGRGSVIRDIADASTYDIFRTLLKWKGDIAVGSGNKNSITENSQTNNNVIEFNGNVPLSSGRTNILNSQTTPNMISQFSIEVEDSISEIIKKYHPNYNGTEIVDNQASVSLLLQDGTWDIVYTFHPGFSIDIPVSYFTLHHANKDYARTTDGYLKCRISNIKYVYGRGPVRTTDYYALDYLPQVAVMAMSKVLNTSEDEYYTDVEIGYKNIEGTTRIVVSQYDDGEDVPFQFELSDIKSGKFTATVDKEYPTTFIITSYNKNGSTTSETYVLEALQPITDLGLTFKYSNDKIEVASKSKRLNDRRIIKSYTISDTDYAQPKSAHVVRNTDMDISYQAYKSNTIDVTELSKGMYVLNIIDIFGKRHSFKFFKK